MKKFYNEPEMNISMFEVENVVTTSGDPSIDCKKPEEVAAAKLADLGVAEGNIVTFTW